MRKFVNLFVLLAIVVVGHGYGPNVPMARRAAVVDCYKQFNDQGIHKGFRIVSEGVADDGGYEVTMEGGE